MSQCIHKQIGIFSTIETKLHLGKVGREMFCADLMPRSDDAKLQQGEGIFDCVDMNIAEGWISVPRYLGELLGTRSPCAWPLWFTSWHHDLSRGAIVHVAISSPLGGA